MAITDPPVEATMPELERGTIARNALWRVVESGGSELLSILFFIILGRLLTPADFGIIATAGAILLSCQVILRGGLSVAVIQRDRLEPAHFDAAFWTNLGLAALLAGLLIAVSAPMAAALGEPSLAPVMAALSPSLVLSGAAWIFHARFKRALRYDVVVLSALTSILSGGVAGVLLALAGAGVWSLVGQQIAGSLMGLVVLVSCSPWWPARRFSRAHLRDLASFSSKVVASHGLETVSQRAIPLILAFFVTAHMVGLYAIASRLCWALANMSMFVVFDLGLVILSRRRGRPERHREGAYFMLRMTTLLCLPLFLGAALIADPLIPLLLGANWIESVPLFQLLCLFNVLFALCRSAQQILISAGRPETALRLALVIATLVPAFTLAAAFFGIVAATAAAGVAMMAALPVAVRCLRVELGLDVPRLLIEQIPLWLSAGVMALVVWLLALAMGGMTLHVLVLVTLQVVCGSGAFVATMMLLAPAFAREVTGTLGQALGRLAPGD